MQHTSHPCVKEAINVIGVTLKVLLGWALINVLWAKRGFHFAKVTGALRHSYCCGVLCKRAGYLPVDSFPSKLT